jgi:hypothetical protein
MFLNILPGRLRCIGPPLSGAAAVLMVFALTVTILIIAGAAAQAWTVLLGYGLFALIERRP